MLHRSIENGLGLVFLSLTPEKRRQIRGSFDIPGMPVQESLQDCPRLLDLVWGRQHARLQSQQVRLVRRRSQPLAHPLNGFRMIIIFSLGDQRLDQRASSRRFCRNGRVPGLGNAASAHLILDQQVQVDQLSRRLGLCGILTKNLLQRIDRLLDVRSRRRSAAQLRIRVLVQSLGIRRMTRQIASELSGGLGEFALIVGRVSGNQGPTSGRAFSITPQEVRGDSPQTENQQQHHQGFPVDSRGSV